MLTGRSNQSKKEFIYKKPWNIVTMFQGFLLFADMLLARTSHRSAFSG